MSGTHNKLQHGNKVHHWKLSGLVLDLNYFSFSHHNPCRNPTNLPKHEFLNPNDQFYQRIWYVEYYSVHAYMVWSQKFRKSEISFETGSGTERKTQNPAGVDSGNADPAPPLIHSTIAAPGPWSRSRVANLSSSEKARPCPKNARKGQIAVLRQIHIKYA